MSTSYSNTTTTVAALIDTAADLITLWGLCRTDYRDPSGQLDPSGAVAVALGLDADVWTCPPDHVAAGDDYQAGFTALWLMVRSLGYEMDDPDEEPWDGEMLANHVAFWLEEMAPSQGEVVSWMREVAAVYRQREARAA